MAIDKRVKREQRVKLIPVQGRGMRITSMEDELLVGSSDDYFIYMKNVNLRPNGGIEGRFLGENPKAIIDEHCRQVEFSAEEGKWLDKEGGKPFTSARMVAVNNQTGETIIIQQNVK